MITFKFRIYPTGGQVVTLSRHIDICRRLYNRLLAVVRDARTRGEWFSWQDLQALLPAWKKSTFLELQEVYSHVTAMAAKRLHANLASLAAKKQAGRKAGKLRFKARGLQLDLLQPVWFQDRMGSWGDPPGKNRDRQDPLPPANPRRI